VNKPISSELTEWQLWSGNRELPKRWKHYVISTEQNITPGPALSVPNKPPYWQTITEQIAEGIDPTAPINEGKEENEELDKPSSASRAFEEFASTLPWLNGLLSSELKDLESQMTIQELSNGDTICNSGDPSPFTLVR
jgi:hypothetical protein